MKTRPSRIWRQRAILLAVPVAVALPLPAQTYTATPISAGSADYREYPYTMTGAIAVLERTGTNYRGSGSGAVVKHPRVVFSCAHVVFEKGQVDPWLSTVRWHRAAALDRLPPPNTGQLLRGYQYYSGYTSSAQQNLTSSASFAQDFVVHYAFENTADGGYAGSWDDGVSILKSGRTKLITGYPAGLYPSDDSRRYLMHRTGPFSRAFSSANGDFLVIEEVSTGAGNSGGPVWVSDGTSYYFAGVLVSGLERSTGDATDRAGVYGVDSSSTALIEAAIREAGGAVNAPASAPVITSHPTSRRANVGEAVSFSVTASGNGLSYRWLFNGTAVAGATSSTFALTNLTLAQAGTYQAVVSNAGGEVRSNQATLSVDVPAPVITTQPASQTVAPGSTVSFSVTATGAAPLTYQWTFSNAAGQTSVVPGATGATLSLNAVDLTQAGSYTVTVRNSAGASVTSRPATLNVTAPNAGASGGANDRFASATVLSGAAFSITGSNVGASREAGEPTHPDSSGGASVWWVWSAPASGTVTLGTAGSSFDTILAVYTGASLGSLTRVAADDDSGTGSASLVTFSATAGTTYRFMVDGYGGITGSVSLTLNLVAPAGGGAGNDQFANRTPLPAAGGSFSSTNVGATREPAEPNHAGLSPTRSVWFTWTATSTGQVTVSTSGSNFDTVLAIYTGGALGSLVSVASNDDFGSSTASQVSFNATAGVTYQIAVDGYSSETGTIRLLLTPPVGPIGSAVANDSFARASPIGATGGTFSVSSVGATREPGEPDHANNQGGASVWWTWTAPTTGAATVTTAGSNFDTVLAIYTGAALTSLTTIAANDDGPDDLTSSATFNVQAGQTYRIAVDGYGGRSGNIRLTLSTTSGGGTPTAPANDTFANRTALPAAGGSASGTNQQATAEIGEPNHAGVAGGRSVWWTWTAASASTCVISTSGSNFDTLLAVYRGNTLGTLAAVASNDNESAGTTTSSVRFATTAGTTYQIAVDGRGAASGNIRLTVSAATTGPTAPGNDAFANRLSIPPGGGSVEGSNANASPENGEPAHASLRAARSVWWTWTPSRSGAATLSTSGSSFDTVLAVYRGSTLTALTEVASNDDAGGAFTSSLSFMATAGTTYQVAVDGFLGATGSVRLNASLAATAETDRPTVNTRLANLSVRSPAGSGVNTLVVGFAISGPSPKPILIRAIGPTLANFGVPGPMTDPILTVYRGAAPIELNDNWGLGASADPILTRSRAVGAFPLDRNSRDAAILINLLPGAYTAQVSAAGTSANGVALLEVYDTDYNADADATGRKLINISSRAQVGTGANAMFAGFFVLGPSAKRVLVRGIGPALAAFGVPDALADAQILVRRDTTVVAANDNWSGTALAAAATATGAFPLSPGSRDAALLADLPPGAYTVELSGTGGATGVGLIEVYEVP